MINKLLKNALIKKKKERKKLQMFKEARKYPKMKEKSMGKYTLNHYKQIRMIFAKSFTYTSEKLLPPLLYFWLFSTNHGSCATSWNLGPLSLAVMSLFHQYIVK